MFIFSSVIWMQLLLFEVAMHEKANYLPSIHSPCSNDLDRTTVIHTVTPSRKVTRRVGKQTFSKQFLVIIKGSWACIANDLIGSRSWQCSPGSKFCLLCPLSSPPNDSYFCFHQKQVLFEITYFVRFSVCRIKRLKSFSSRSLLSAPFHYS